MTLRALLRSQLITDEGIRLHAYQDSEGYWTIGVGRLIDKRLGGGITKEEAMVLLEHDIDKAEKIAKNLFPSFDRLSEGRQAVLCNMAFNLGAARLANFHRMREAVADGAFDRAASEMLDSRWSEQVGERARRLATIMRDG